MAQGALKPAAVSTLKNCANLAGCDTLPLAEPRPDSDE
jgi:hypothetical protein